MLYAVKDGPMQELQGITQAITTTFPESRVEYKVCDKLLQSLAVKSGEVCAFVIENPKTIKQVVKSKIFFILKFFQAQIKSNTLNATEGNQF